MKLSLVVTQGKSQGQIVPITLSQFLIGRDPHCHLRPASPLISKRHCALLKREGKAFVRDLDSTNGTFINECRVQGEVELRDEDRLKIGPLVLIVRVEAAAPAKKPVAVSGNRAKPSPSDDASIAAMLLEGPEGELTVADSDRASDDDISANSTVLMNPPAGSPPPDEPDKPGNEKKEPPKELTADTAQTAKAILDKYMRRTRH